MPIGGFNQSAGSKAAADPAPYFANLKAGSDSKFKINHPLTAGETGPCAILGTIKEFQGFEGHTMTQITGAGKSETVSSAGKGLWTSGQFNCFCVIVAVVNDADGSVKTAGLLHVSSYRDSKLVTFLDRMVGLVKQPEDAYVVIASLKGVQDQIGEIQMRCKERKFLKEKMSAYVTEIAQDGVMGFGLKPDGSMGQVING